MAGDHHRHRTTRPSRRPDLGRQLTHLDTRGSGVRLGGELLDFVANQCHSLRSNERLPETNQVLESAFGKQKSLARSPTKTGFTILLLGLGTTTAQYSGSSPQNLRHQTGQILVRQTTRHNTTIQSPIGLRTGQKPG